MNNTVVFDKPYSADKIAEGMAVSWAVQSGACYKCEYEFFCRSGRNFKFPKNAPCMKKKDKFLKEMKDNE